MPKQRTTIQTILGVSVALACLAGASAAQAVPREEVRGTLVVQATVTGGGDLSGFEYEISSANCAVTPPAHATTDAAGTVQFSGLLVEDGSGSECLYNVAPVNREGYQVDTEDASLTGLTLGPVAEVDSNVALTSSAGIFSNPTRNPESGGNTLAMQCLGGEGTNEMRAGRNPFTGACSLAWIQQSGLGYGSPATLPLPLNEGPELIGEVTHFNQTIERGFHNADLTVTLTFTDTVTGEEVTVTPTYNIRIDETPDLVANPANCRYPEAGDLNQVLACADRISIVGGEDTQVVLGDVVVDLQARLGVLAADGTCGDPVDAIFTPERTDTRFCLLASVPVTYQAETQPVVVSVANVKNPDEPGVDDDDDTNQSDTPESTEAAPAAQEIAKTGAPNVGPWPVAVALVLAGAATLAMSHRLMMRS